MAASLSERAAALRSVVALIVVGVLLFGVILPIDLAHGLFIVAVVHGNIRVIHVHVSVNVLLERVHPLVDHGLELEQLVVIQVLLQVDVLHEPLELLSGDELEEDADDDGADTEAERGNRLPLGDRGHLEEGGAELGAGGEVDHERLEAHFEDEDQPEQVVVEEGREHVLLSLIDNSAVDLVKQVHDHKRMEDECVKLHLVRWIVLFNTFLLVRFLISHFRCDDVEWFIIEHHLAGVHQNEDNGRLVEDLTKDVAPHIASQDLISAADTV